MNLEDVRISLCERASAGEVAEYILGMQDDRRMLTICMLWSWWNARNKANAGELRRPVDDIIHKARLMLMEKEDDGNTRERSVHVNACRRWTAPQPGTWKLNIDGAFWEKERQGAWGFVARDETGCASVAGAGSLPVVMDALCAEAHACIAGLEAAAAQGLQNIVIESDSQTLVKALLTEEYDRAQGGVLFREAKFLMATIFGSVTVVFVPCSCNVVAHELAHLGRCRTRITHLFG